MKRLFDKFINFCKWVWDECKDWHTLVIFIVVVIMMYTPVWGGYLLHILFGIKWGSVIATAYLAFWAGPFTPYFPICIAITFAIKKIIEKITGRKFGPPMILTTERLVLRPWKLTDSQELFKICSNPNVTDPADFNVHKDVEESKLVIKKMFINHPVFAICVKNDDKPIGCVGLLQGKNANLKLKNNEAELGYWMAQEYWGNGYATEAGKEIIKYSFEKLHCNKLFCSYFDDNYMSKRVIQKCKFKFIYNKTVFYQPKNEYKTEFVYAISKQDYLNPLIFNK